VFVFFSFSAVIIPFKDRLNGVRFLVFKGEKWRFLPRSPRSFLGFFSTGVPPPWCGMDAPAALINSATISEMDVEEFLQNGHFNGFGQVWWICDLFLTSFNKRGKRISFCVIIANEIHYDNEQRLREETKGKHDGRSCFVWRQ
jgi:hypothetical protein